MKKNILLMTGLVLLTSFETVRTAPFDPPRTVTVNFGCGSLQLKCKRRFKLYRGTRDSLLALIKSCAPQPTDSRLMILEEYNFRTKKPGWDILCAETKVHTWQKVAILPIADEGKLPFQKAQVISEKEVHIIMRGGIEKTFELIRTPDGLIWKEKTAPKWALYIFLTM